MSEPEASLASWPWWLHRGWPLSKNLGSNHGQYGHMQANVLTEVLVHEAVDTPDIVNERADSLLLTKCRNPKWASRSNFLGVYVAFEPCLPNESYVSSSSTLMIHTYSITITAWFQSPEYASETTMFKQVHPAECDQ